MKFNGAALAALAALAGAAAAPAGPPPGGSLLPLYRMAHAYEVSAFNRSCADVSLRPGLEAARHRLEAARRRLAAAYGEDALRHEEIPLMVPGDPCANPAAARNSAREFDLAVARLETALARARRR
jgi:hypothetical protein